MKKNVKLLVLFLGFLVTSCSNEIEKENINFQQKKYESIQNQNANTKGDIRRIIVSFDIGREKHGCEGFGACNTRWFYCMKDGVEVPCETGTFANVTSTGQFSGSPTYDPITEKYHLDILFGETMEEYSHEELIFIIDELVVLDTEKALGSDLVIPEGEYYFNESLGEFGGIRLDFK